MYEQTRDHIRALSDRDLVEYVLTGARMYELDAVEFARAELDRRSIDPQKLAAIRDPIADRLLQLDLESPPQFVLPHRTSRILCKTCGMEVPNRFVQYQQNIGAIVMRFSRSYSGCFCKKCNRDLFWKTTLITLFLGWWELTSMFVALAFLISNLVGFLRTLPLEAPLAGAAVPSLSESDVEKMAIHIPALLDRLAEQPDYERHARELASLTGVTPGQALVYINRVMRSRYATAGTDGPTRGFPVRLIPPA